MNMKKLMAVVLAVVIAVSAMAINVFAAESEVVRIPLRPVLTHNYSAKTSYEITVPMYNLYGYADMNSYLQFVLPIVFTDSAKKVPTSVTWFLEASGEKVKITDTYKNYTGEGEDRVFFDAASTEDALKTVYVNFGAFKRDYWKNGTEIYWATAPQTVSFNTTNSLKLIAEVELEGYNPSAAYYNGGNLPIFEAKAFNENTYNNKMFAQLYTAGPDGVKAYGEEGADDIAITGSAVWGRHMASKRNDNFSDTIAPYDFVYTDTNQVELTWDMTLANRTYILNAESVELVVELTKKNSWDKDYTAGTAMYRLYMADTAMNGLNIGQVWWNDGGNYNREFKDVAYQTITNETIRELRFEIPAEKLVDLTYGFSAGMTSTFRIYNQYKADKSTFINGKTADGNEVNYNHITDKDHAYLLVTLPAEEDSTEIPVDEIVESNEGNDGIGDGDGEEVNVGDGDETPVEPTPVEPEDTNPPTGIVLAVLPMVVAAVAVVASKRR